MQNGTTVARIAECDLMDTKMSGNDMKLYALDHIVRPFRKLNLNAQIKIRVS